METLMVELIITACMIATPDRCRDHRMALNENITIVQCMMPPILQTLVGWAKEHPDWRVQQWTCRDQKVEKDI